MVTTRERIIDAALRAMTRHGLARLTLEDVAGEAGVSRQTLHRYFGTKDALIRAAILQEEQGFIARVAEAAAAHDDLRPAMEAAIDTALTAAREHPLLDRLLATEPEALLPLLTSGSGPVLTAARPVIADLLSQRLPHLSESEVRRTADALTRLVVSYAVNPPDEPPTVVAGGLADLFVHGVKAE
jgi:AcrR family transcriptional regulator